jgi:hypothetical protein
MPVRSNLALAVSVFLICLSAGAQYPGNGHAGFGGPIGLGSLTLSDDGTTLSGTVNKGPNGLNDVLVIYIDTFTGGFASTAGFNDASDGLRRAISGIDTGSNRSPLAFGAGFSPSYAVALGPASDSFGGLFGLANGNAGSLNFISSVNLSPTGNNGSPTYTFSLALSQVGLTPMAGQSFRLMGSYISNTGYRSDEALPGDDTGAQGWNPFMVTATVTYTTVPEPSSLALFGLSALALAIWRRRSA